MTSWKSHSSDALVRRCDHCSSWMIVGLRCGTCERVIARLT